MAEPTSVSRENQAIAKKVKRNRSRRTAEVTDRMMNIRVIHASVALDEDVGVHVKGCLKKIFSSWMKWSITILVNRTMRAIRRDPGMMIEDAADAAGIATATKRRETRVAEEANKATSLN